MKKYVLKGGGATKTIQYSTTKKGVFKKDSRRYVAGPLDNLIYKSTYVAKSGKIAKVKAQQWALLNSDLSFVLGT